jgi:hypothetical protein
VLALAMRNLLCNPWTGKSSRQPEAMTHGVRASSRERGGGARASGARDAAARDPHTPATPAQGAPWWSNRPLTVVGAVGANAQIAPAPLHVAEVQPANSWFASITTARTRCRAPGVTS